MHIFSGKRGLTLTAIRGHGLWCCGTSVLVWLLIFLTSELPPSALLSYGSSLPLAQPAMSFNLTPPWYYRREFLLKGRALEIRKFDFSCEVQPAPILAENFHYQ